MLNITTKTIKRIFFLPLFCVSILCFSQQANPDIPANEKGRVEFLRSENGHIYFQVNLTGIPPKGCLLSISNQLNEVIYEQRIYSNAYSKVFKFPDYSLSKINFDISGKKYQVNRSFDLNYIVETKLEVTKL